MKMTKKLRLVLLLGMFIVIGVGLYNTFTKRAAIKGAEVDTYVDVDKKVVLMKGEEFIPAEGYTLEDIRGVVDTERVGKYDIFYCKGWILQKQQVWVTNIGWSDDYYISLNGEETIYLDKGDAFKDPGATIYQMKDYSNLDNNVRRDDWSKEIVVEGEVDVNTSGSYEIKYCTPYGQWARRTVIVYNERRRVTSKTSNEKPLPPINYSEDPIETEYNRHDLDSTGNKDEYPNSNSNDDEDNHLGANFSKSEETGRDY